MVAGPFQPAPVLESVDNLLATGPSGALPASPATHTPPILPEPRAIMYEQLDHRATVQQISKHDS